MPSGTIVVVTRRDATESPSNDSWTLQFTRSSGVVTFTISRSPVANVAPLERFRSVVTAVTAPVLAMDAVPEPKVMMSSDSSARMAAAP